MKWLLLSCLVAFCGAQRTGVSQNQQGRRRPPPSERQPIEQPPLEPEQYEAAYASECPLADGFFADVEQCDKYYQCRNYTLTEKLCEDGYAFVENHNNYRATCDFLFNVDCTDRPLLQPPKKTPNCPRANGFFPHEDPKVCDAFYQCSSGKSNLMKCGAALVFDLNTGACSWPEAAKRQGCQPEDVLKFTCPKQTLTQKQKELHPRYADPDDCQYFYVCLEGKTPRRNGCGFGQAFSEESKQCEDAENVPECVNWYEGDPRYEAYLQQKRLQEARIKSAQPKVKRRRRPQRPVQIETETVAKQPVRSQPQPAVEEPLRRPAVQEPQRRPAVQEQHRRPAVQETQQRYRPIQRRPASRPVLAEPEIPPPAREPPRQPISVLDIINGQYFNEKPEAQPEQPQEQPQQEPPVNNRFRNRPGGRFGVLRRRYSGRQPAEAVEPAEAA